MLFSDFQIKLITVVISPFHATHIDRMMGECGIVYIKLKKLIPIRPVGAQSSSSYRFLHFEELPTQPQKRQKCKDKTK